MKIKGFKLYSIEALQAQLNYYMKKGLTEIPPIYYLLTSAMCNFLPVKEPSCRRVL